MENKDKVVHIRDSVFDNSDQWNSRELGAEESFVKKSGMPKKLKAKLNERSNQKMQLISMRLPISLIENLKEIGEQEGLGYQSLAREVLQRFAEAENRKQINKLIAERRNLEKELEQMKVEIKELKQA
jgi:predicted DNA binding CopG/RHH family protein